MALQALKETKHSAVRCRLSPPTSPSKRAASSSSAAVGKPQPFKSKLLAALDAEMENILPKTNVAVNVGPKGAAIAHTGQPQKASGVAAGSGSRTNHLTNTIHPFYQASKRKTHTSLISKPAAPMHSVASVLTPGPLEPPPKVRKKTTMPPPPIAMDRLVELAEESIIAASSLKKVEQPLKEPMLYSYKDYSPEPAIVYTCHEEEANELVSCLRGPLGFDMEWRVFFTRGAGRAPRRTALVQLCDKRMIVLIQISSMQRFPQKVKELIEDPSVIKAGANILNDGKKLFADFGIEAANLVELGALACAVDGEAFKKAHKRRIVSLAEMVRCYCDEKVLEKGDVRTGNWEAAPLTDEQKKYAANDVHSGLMVALKLLERAKERELRLDPTVFTSKVSGFAAVEPAEEPTAPEDDAQTLSGDDTPCPPSVDPMDALNPPPRPQHMRAYNFWHRDRRSLDDIRAALRTKENPLAASTVISYVIWALQADASLPYSMQDLKALVQLEIGSWARHREWILKQGPKGRQ